VNLLKNIVEIKGTLVYETIRGIPWVSAQEAVLFLCGTDSTEKYFRHGSHGFK
jgi:hypothetical protein